MRERVRVKEREGVKKERMKEERVWSVVINDLVKADLLCEFLISVHLPVVPPHRMHNVEHTCYHSHTSVHIPGRE